MHYSAPILHRSSKCESEKMVVNQDWLLAEYIDAFFCYHLLHVKKWDWAESNL